MALAAESALTVTAEAAPTNLAAMPNESSGTPAAIEAASRGLTPWGIKEIAAFTKRDHNTVRQWSFYKSVTNPEKDWPEPDWREVGGRPAWAERTVLLHLYVQGAPGKDLTPAQKRHIRTLLNRWGVEVEGQ